MGEHQVFLFGKNYMRVKSGSKIKNIQEKICQDNNLCANEFYLVQNGRKIEDLHETVQNSIHAILRLSGGKGGFGSMLRAIGAQIEKTTNREACRDLSGRRLRDINEEKRLKAWLEKQNDRALESEAKRKRKIEKLMTVPKHEFKDSEYETARSELTEKVSEAVEEGFKKAAQQTTESTSLKRKAIDKPPVPAKKAVLWIGDGLSSDSDSSDSESNNDDEVKVKQSVVESNV